MSWKDITFSEAERFVSEQFDMYAGVREQFDMYASWTDPCDENYEQDEDQRRYYEHRRDICEYVLRCINGGRNDPQHS